MADDLKQLAVETAGLDPRWADRLRGDTLEELTADARSLVELMPHAKGPAKTNEPNGRLTRDELRDMADTDPGPFNELVESGRLNLDTGELTPEHASASAGHATLDGGFRREPHTGSAAELRALARNNPELFNNLVDAGEINPADMRDDR